ncbi:hypothetical protein [Pedobacter borealis]|uniref:hypothetical protein n=1 Tax=Pedobacter borealis TaxID=475254 RepID=UPI0004935E06|nr:hypothetical protein [Pedobacter borealis]
MTQEEFQNLYEHKIKPFKHNLFFQTKTKIDHKEITACIKLFEEFIVTLKLDPQTIKDLIQNYRIELSTELKK